MSTGDKAKDVVQQAAGKAEQVVGERTDDRELTEQGRKDQSMGADRLDTERSKDVAEH